MNLKRLSIVMLLWMAGGIALAQTRLLRFPDIQGDQVVFTYAGDLYTVSSNGGMSRKLTSHIGYEMFAKYSPDGNTIAFTGQYDGNTEVFTIPSKGGTPKRLTHTATLSRDDVGDRMGPNNIVMEWTPDGQNIIYRSRKQSFNSFRGQLFKVPIEGGSSVEIPISDGGFCSFSPDGKKMAYNHIFREFRTWKRYKGGMADDIRILDLASGSSKKITHTPNQEIFPMWAGKKIYFLSDCKGTMNLFCFNTTTEETKQLTHFKEYDIKFPSLGKENIVFENGGYIYKFNLQSKEAQKLHITIADDQIYSRPQRKDVSKQITSAALSPNGERIVFSARGDIYTVPAKHGITRNITLSSSANDRNATWSPNGKYLAFISDRSGEFQLYIQIQDGSKPAIQLTNKDKTFLFNVQWSPDSKKLLWHDKKNRLQYIDIDTKKITLVEQSPIRPIGDYSWSPDSKWIAFTRPQKTMSMVCLYELNSHKSYPVTQGWYSSSSPTFSSDGKYLVFSSQRDFNPIYSSTEWNHAYTDMERIYLATLSKKTKSPFAPENDEVVIEKETSEKNKTKKSKSKIKKEKVSPKTELTIDPSGIQNRIISIPVKAANYFNIQALDNKIYYQKYSRQNGVSTCLYDLKKKKEIELGKNLNFTISPNGTMMLVSKNKQFQVIDLPTSKVSIQKATDLSGLETTVNYRQEWKQIYDESWRQMRDFFYDRNMHGVDWDVIYKRYAQLVPFVNHRSDLTYILGEMIGELNVGHAYSANGEHPQPRRITTGLLGARISHHTSGYFHIDKILQGANWNKSQRSPLTEIGVEAEEGDYIIAVNGKSTKQIKDLYQALVGTANKQVELTLNNTPSQKGSHKTIVIPIADESELYYHQWVQNNIKKVSDATNGKVGYIHIPDMGVKGLNEFVKHYYPQLNRKALIIDDRGNGGGNVSPMITERLKRTMTFATMHTGQKEGSVNPVGTFLGPKVLLVNGYSASDGDLFPYRFKFNKLGTVIGTRTWGGVVGYSGYIAVVDGGHIVTPSYAPFAADGSKFIIEGRGVTPDVILENDPAKEYLGQDQQLNKAIEIIMQQLKEKESSVPAIPKFPNKTK